MKLLFLYDVKTSNPFQRRQPRLMASLPRNRITRGTRTLLVTKGIATRSKDATSSSWHYYNKKLLVPLDHMVMLLVSGTLQLPSQRTLMRGRWLCPPLVLHQCSRFQVILQHPNHPPFFVRILFLHQTHTIDCLDPMASPASFIFFPRLHLSAMFRLSKSIAQSTGGSSQPGTAIL